VIGPPEKRKVGSSTLPLTTLLRQHECPGRIIVRGFLVSTDSNVIDARLRIESVDSSQPKLEHPRRRDRPHRLGPHPARPRWPSRVNDCLAPHLPEPQPICTRLVWLTARNEPRRRTRLWTCHCDDAIHELCATGGQAFLRRTDPGSGKAFETHRMSTRKGDATWQALLSGLAL
jgi:hypothetical protein